MPHSFERMLWSLRERGWRVGVHNDYRHAGVDMTFYLLTHPDGTFVKGEGQTDMDALMDCDEAIRARAELPNAAPISPRIEGAAVERIGDSGAENSRLREAMHHACDLLSERKRGSPARSPGHNARLHLHGALNSTPLIAEERGG